MAGLINRLIWGFTPRGRTRPRRAGLDDRWIHGAFQLTAFAAMLLFLVLGWNKSSTLDLISRSLFIVSFTVLVGCFLFRSKRWPRPPARVRTEIQRPRPVSSPRDSPLWDRDLDGR